MLRGFGARISRHHYRPKIERLEDRTVPSAVNFTPPRVTHRNDFALSAVNTGRQVDPVSAAIDYVSSHAAELGWTAADATNPIVSNQYTDADIGVSHVYLRQRLDGLAVPYADLSISVLANGQVFTVAGGFVNDLANKVRSPEPGSVLSALDALQLAAGHLGLDFNGDAEYVDNVLGPVQTYSISAPSLSEDVIPGKLVYAPTDDGSAVLAWDFVLRVPGDEHWYNAEFDATTGALINVSNWYDDAHYNVVPAPNESPNDGGLAVLVNPHATNASPHGWHDTNGVAGAEFTDTRGNNVDAHMDRDFNNSADGSPPRSAGGAALNFGLYSFDAASAPDTTTNMNAAMVNLFYMNNWIHDVTYQYGFTEGAGNFQTNNFGKGGSGNDAVQADAQDGSGTGNANFGTPGDGSAPRMQMFVWTNANPDRDSDMDNGVVVHEYTHGISNRLTDINANGLNPQQSGGMGEGWGDFFGLMFMQRPTDSKTSSHGIGTYLLNQPVTGSGIRRFRYSTDMFNVNPLKWDAYGSGTVTYTMASGNVNVTRTTQVHNTGEIWASTLWDLNWKLIDKYGYDPNLLTGWSSTFGPGRAGNKLALKLVTEGMKLQGASPSFTDARDAILEADMILTGGANQFEIWSVFANRGLGANVNVGTASSTATIVANSDLPMLVAGVNPAAESTIASAPLSYVVTLTAAANPSFISPSSFKVNGQAATSHSYTPGSLSVTFTFATNAVTGEGPQTITIADDAFTRNSDSQTSPAYSSTFYVETTPLSITSFTPTSGSTLSPPSFTVDVNLNLAINPASVQTTDLSLTRGRVSDVEVLNSDKTVRFTVTDIAEGTIPFQFAKGAFTDVDGNPSAANAGGSYTLEYNVAAPFTTPFTRENPVGAFVYEGSQFGQIGTAGDADSFTLNLDPNQTATVIVSPAASLRPSVNITGPGTNLSNTAATNGSAAQLAMFPIGAGGTFTITMSGAASTTGGYTIRVIVNTAEEAEAGAGLNDSPASAESLTPAFIDLGNGMSRAAIRGTADVVSVPESESNNTTGTANPITVATVEPTNLYHLGLNGTTGNDTVGAAGDDRDYFSLGQLQAGDIITMTMSGSFSGRGTHPDTLLQLRRLNSDTSALTIVASDDDSGPHDSVGGDSLIYRFTVTATDSYFARLYRAGSASSVGTYQLGIMLENTSTVPATGGAFPGDVESNGSSPVAVNTANLWKPVKYLSTASGSITAGDTDLFAYSLNAGEFVTLNTRAMSPGLIPQSALLDSTGTPLATENGTSNVAGAGGQSPIYGYVIPTTGTYYHRVTGASGTTGSYVADLYRSTTVTLTLAPAVKDHYSVTLAAGQSMSAAIDGLTTGNVDIAIVDAAGAVLAGSTASTNFDEIVNYTAPSAGTYYVRVNGDAETEYAVVVTRGAALDANNNNNFPTAQSIDTTKSVIGAITAGDSDWFLFNATAGQVIDLVTTTPGGGAGEPSNGLDPTIELYDPTAGMIDSDTNSAGDGKNATLSKVAPLTGSYRARVLAASSTTGEYTLRVTIAAAPAAAKVADVIIDDDSGQRSIISQLVVNFDQAVTLPVNPADAFTLATLGGAPVNLAATSSNSPNTSVTITFTGGAFDGTSLVDGRYVLTALASQINSGNFDGDGNGTAGDNYVLASAASPNPPTNIFRIFGDENGDAFTDNLDLIAFRAANGSDTSTANWNRAFDANGDDFVDNQDFIEFRARLGLVI